MREGRPDWIERLLIAALIAVTAVLAVVTISQAWQTFSG